MKICLLIVSLIFSLLCSAQKYALIHERWAKPIEFTDTLINEKINEGWFPVYKSELDSLKSLIEKLNHIFKDGMKRKIYNENEFSTEHITMEIANVKLAYGDRYDITMKTQIETFKLSLKLSESRLPNTENQKKIKAFYAYLDKNKKAWQGYLQ